ncbi:uncharacterized protein LOC128206646 [Mya arenaria]|uniref:uncharacterized protein LOC128206646 n=1 Tax=Mya arenaria TaxID=6604 RepID=UPI0022DEFFE3|nr:uncharacterized protein LOC128206646 [Mya arenaria]
MDSIKETLNNVRKRLVRCANPRANTDAMSEVLDIIGAPIYLYVITYVCYFGYHYLDDYHYGEIDENGERRWIWYFQKGLIVCIYFQMMANWFEIRFVDSSLANAAKNMTLDQQTLDKIKLPDKTEAEITEKGDCKTQNESGAVKRRKGGKTDKNNGSALVQVKKISYWSWKPCDKCQLNAPPRCHHCPFCNVCVLKRDHHCFFAGKCVGFENQRHFIVFLIWASFSTTYAMVYFLPFFYNNVLIDHSWWDCFFPVTLFKFVIGHVDFYHFNLITCFTMNFLFVFLSTAFLLEQYQLVSAGWTQFEQTKVDKRKLHIHDPRPLSAKIKAVLGQRPLVTILCPIARIWYPPCEDPFQWPDHKVTHHKVK